MSRCTRGCTARVRSPAASIVELRDAILRGTIPEPPRGSKVPKWLRKVVLRGLAVEPADRYPEHGRAARRAATRPGAYSPQVFAGLGVGAVLIAGGYGLAQATTGADVCPDVA